jgi:DNA-binding transcriptional MerR regulator
VSTSEQHLSPAEVARQLGVSVRALKVYETRGLLSPMKTARGWRAYGPAQIGRLHQILTLKGLGLSLAQIAGLLPGRDSDLAATLEVQSAALHAERDRTDAAIQRVEAARRTLAQGGPLQLSQLIDLIRETTMTAQQNFMDAYLERLKRRLTPEEFERLPLRAGWAHSRSGLQEELRTLAAGREDPLSAASADFMRRWLQFHYLAVGLDEALARKASDAWLDTMADPAAASDAPYGEVERRYLRAVSEAIFAEMRRLYARADQIAGAVDPGSPDALALVLRLRSLTGVYTGHLTKARQDAVRAQMLRSRRGGAGASLSDAAADFLIESNACTDALIAAA